MKDLTIIIRAEEKESEDYIEKLKPLLLCYSPELIFINSEIDMNIPYKHSVYRYSYIHREFNNFCFASSLGNRIIIIEKGLRLTEDFIELLIKKLKSNDYFNIIINLKSYLSKNKTIYFINEKTFVYNRGVTGFNELFNITIEDYSYIETDISEIEVNIENLVDGKHFHELYIWYEKFILEMPTDFQLEFCITLEKIKQFMETDDITKLETFFLESETQNQYIKYLSFKRMLRNDKSDGYKNVNNQLKKSMNINQNTKYYCWLLKDFLINRILPLFIIYLDKESQDLLCQLLDIDEDAPIYFHECIMYLSDHDKNFGDHIDELGTYILIIQAYIDHMVKKSEDFPEKLINVFYLYLKYVNDYVGNANAKSIISENEKNFIRKFNRAKSLINEAKTENTISMLDKICNEYPDKEKILNYYINEIRYVNNIYPYKLSICMIVKNEEKNLDRCLSSLKILVDIGMAEIIIVDTGSTDRTLDIAKKYTERVYLFSWGGHFSEARNRSIQSAKGEYVLIMDADEKFSKTEINKLISEFSSERYKEYNTYTLVIKSFTNPENTLYAAMVQHRIFRNNGNFYYNGAVHNQPKLEVPIKDLNIEVLHYGYIMTDDIRDKKYLRTATLLKKELEKTPRNTYYRYQLSTSYSMHGDLGKAVKEADILYRLLKENKSSFLSNIMYYNNITNIYLESHRYNEAEIITDEALAVSPQFIDFVYYKIYISFKKHQYLEALDYCNQYLEISNNYFALEIAKKSEFSFYTIGNKDYVLMISVISNYRLKKYKKCLETAFSIEDHIALKNCINEIVDAYICTDQYTELTQFYKTKVECIKDQDMKNIFIYFLLERLLSSSKEDMKLILHILEQNLNIQFIKDIKLKIKKGQNISEHLEFLSNYGLYLVDFESTDRILMKIIPQIKNKDVLNYKSANKMISMKKVMQIILHNAKEINYYNILTIEELAHFFNLYLSLCVKIIEKYKTVVWEPKEVFFLSKITKALNMDIDYRNVTVTQMEDAIMDYINMDEIVHLVINHYILNECNKNGLDHQNDQNNVTQISDDHKCDGENSIEVSQSISNDSKKIEVKKSEIVDCNEAIKVLHGTMDITDKTMDIVKALRKKGIFARGLNYLPDYESVPSDYKIDITSFDDDKKDDRTLEIAMKMISQFDIFHFHYLTTLTLDHSDLMILNELKKKVFMHCWGHDVRLFEKVQKFNPYLPNIDINDEEIKRELERISKYVSNCIICDYELEYYVNDFFEYTYQINRMLDISKYLMCEYSRGSKFTIVHPIVNPQLQGSEIIMKTIDKLQNRYNIYFKPVNSITSKKDKKFCQEADLIIDQIQIGSYSQHSIEAMALGKPVVAWITDAMMERYPKELPIIVANPDTLESKLDYILRNRDMLKDLGTQGRRYVEKYHDINNEIIKLIQLYKK